MRLALCLWCVVAAVVSVRTLVVPEKHTIFPVLAGGTAHWWSDRPLYADYAPLDYFRYPPFFAVGFTPFWVLGPRCGGVLWGLLGISVFLLGLWRFLRDVKPACWNPAREAVFLGLGALAALRGLWNGQSNALAVGLLLLAAAALVRRRGWTAAAVLAASVLVKLTPLAPALFLCALRPRRLPIRLLLFLIVGLSLPFLTRPPRIVLDHYREWAAQCGHLGGARWPGFRDAWTVWLVLRETLHGRLSAPPLREPLNSSVYRAAQLLTAAAVLAWCLWRRRRIAEARRLTTEVLAMGLAWLMLFGPAVEQATYVFLTPVLTWALLERDGPPGGRRLVVSAFVLIMLLGWGFAARPVTAAAPVMLAALPVGTTLFVLWLVGYGFAAPVGSRFKPGEPGA